MGGPAWKFAKLVEQDRYLCGENRSRAGTLLDKDPAECQAPAEFVLHMRVGDVEKWAFFCIRHWRKLQGKGTE